MDLPYVLEFMFQQCFKYLFFVVLLFFTNKASFGQCNLLTGNRNITYLVDGQCAPTTVTQFTIEYEFLSAQIPADISIRFEWNDPGTNTDTYTLGDPGFMVSAVDTRFQATGTFPYPVNNDCAFFPTAFLLINGVACVSSEEEKTAISWDTDDNFGGILAINPPVYEVCFGDAIIGAQFTDNSTFNCNITAEPDNPNQIERHVQFVYGDVTTHNAANTILDLTLDNGGTQLLTDGAGAIATPVGPLGTGGTQITAAYFGPVQNVPFPANAPNAASFQMNAPANVLNAVGNTFEVTMYNWNICNPYNGNAMHPNYDEAISITANITIVTAPVPSFVTREVNAGGVITTDFCIGEVVYFDNQTGGGGLNYLWQYFDGPLDTDPPLGSSTATNPTNIFNTGGQKLIRLTATNPTAQSACAISIDLIINVTPTLVANIRVTDLMDVDITPHFCQDATISQSFNVRFYDIAAGVATASTDRRWEFYDESGALSSSVPPGVGFITGVGTLDPPDQSYTTPGNYEVKFISRDNITGCETEASEFVRIYADPVANFTATEVCEGVDTHFEDMTVLVAINGESITSYEWDFSYDGVIFTKDPAFDGMTSFDYNLGVANSYNVALRVVTDQNNCESILAQNVFVRPQPISSFLIDQNAGCSVLPIEFTNTGDALQPTTMKEYVWQIDFNDGAGFIDYETQDPLDASFVTVFIRNFTNISPVNQVIDIRLKSVNVFDCEVTSAFQSVTIYPAPQAGYASLDYDPFADNCGNTSVNFEVDASTQALAPTGYTWRVTDDSGVLLQPDVVKPPADPTFLFLFSNTSSVDVMDFDVRLTADFIGGCPDDSTRTIRINPIPSATFETDTLVFECQLMTMQMEANQKGLSEYAWEVIINGVTTLTTTTLGDLLVHDFNRPAAGLAGLSVDVRLQTINFASCQSTLEQFSFIVPAQDNINAGFIVTPLTQTLPDRTITITNTTNTGTWNYLWDFGDGQTSSNVSIGNHEYTTYGDYTVTLTVNSDYCIETVSQTITINPIPPIVDFEYTPEEGCAPLTVQFTNLTQFAEADSYMWDFGDGGAMSQAVNPTYTYVNPGVYTVSLSASNGLGDETIEVKQNIIEAFQTPTAIFNIRPEIVFLPNPIYTNNNSFGATTFIWDFGDGSTSTEFEPIHEYTELNTDDLGSEIGYDVSLIAINENGCRDTTLVSNAVIAKKRGGLLIPNAFSPNLSGPSSGGIDDSGSNDIFLPITENVSSFQMQIFNKWGEMLFESSSKQSGWDGYYKGKLVPQDVYVYRLSLEFDNGTKETRVGDVTLIR